MRSASGCVGILLHISLGNSGLMQNLTQIFFLEKKPDSHNNTYGNGSGTG